MKIELNEHEAKLFKELSDRFREFAFGKIHVTFYIQDTKPVRMEIEKEVESIKV